MIRRPSYASVMSTLALFIALGGTGYAAVGTSGGATAGSAARSQQSESGPPLLAYAHVTADVTNPALVTLDSGESYNVTGVYAAGAVQPSGKEFVCIYGNFVPHAIAATAQLNAGQKGAQLTQVDMGGWMIQRCPQGQNGIQGHVVAVVTLPIDLFAPTHGPLARNGAIRHSFPVCSTTVNVNGTRQTAHSDPSTHPTVVSPDPHQCGVYVLFY